MSGMYTRLAVAAAAAVLCADVVLGVAVLTSGEIGYYLGLRTLLAVRLALFAVVGARCSDSLGLRPVRIVWGDRHAFGRVVVIATLCGLGFAGYTHMLFGLTNSSYETGDLGWHRWVSNVALAPLVEEIVYRLGIQNFLAALLLKKGWPYWAAIVATSFLFALGHAGAMQPAWVKLAQMLPVSLVLGLLYQRYGLESCWAAHTVFNGLIWWGATST